MRRQILNFIVPAIIVTLILSLTIVVPASGDQNPVVSKLERLHDMIADEHPSLGNKVNAVIHQVEAGAINGAINKLENDLIKSIEAWVDDPEDALALVREIILDLRGISRPDFEIDADPDELEIEQGSFDTSTITITSKNNFTQEVVLINATSASGVTLSLDPDRVTPPANGSVTSTLRVEVASDVEPDDYDITVTGTSGSLVHSVEIELEVVASPPPPPARDFSITASPDTLSIQKGDSDMSVITVTSLEGFSEPVDLAVTSAPITGVTTTLDPLQVIPPSDSSAISILSIEVATDALLGSYTVTVNGESDSLTHSTNITLQITAPTTPPTPPTPDFSIVASSAALVIEQGDSATSAIIVVSKRGFNQPVDLTVTSAPIAGVSVTLEPSEVTPEPNGFATSTLEVSVVKTAAPNDYVITVAGTNGTLTRTVNVSLKIIFEKKSPEIVSVLRLKEKPSYNESVTVLASVTDVGSGVKEVILNYLQGTTSKNVTMILREGTYQASIPAFPFDASVQYRVYASDKAGNSAKSSLYSYIVSDPYPPIIDIPQWSPLEPAANEQITISVIVTEPVNASDVDQVVLLYQNTTLDVWEELPMTSTQDGNWTVVLAGQSDTAVNFMVEATDNAGNTAREEGEFAVAAPAGFPLAWILAAIAIILAGSGGAAYYLRRRQKKGKSASSAPAISSTPSPPPEPTSLLVRKPPRRRSQREFQQLMDTLLSDKNAPKVDYSKYINA